MWVCMGCGHPRDMHQFDGPVLQRCLGGIDEDNPCECEGYQAKYVPGMIP